MASIILIGPQKAGKSTVGRLLARRLGMPFYDLAADSGRYYEAAGSSGEGARRARQVGGFEGLYRYMRPYEAAAVEGGVADHPDHVIELGALQAIYDDAALRGRVRAALRGQSVVLLLPSPDVDESLRALEDRRYPRIHGVPWPEHFVRNPSNRRLAKQTVYTRGRTPGQTADDVIAALDPGDETVVLMGPFHVGKSTVGALLARRLGRPQLSVDAVCNDYYREIGWSEEEQGRRRRAEGFPGLYRYWKPFHAHTVERVTAEHRGSVIDFGAGHSVYEDEALFARAEAALAPLRNVVLLLPSPDEDESVAILHECTVERVDGVEINRFLVTSPGLRELATLTAYTAGEAPEATADAIAARLPKEPR
jgi:deoxyadenosine/deoxycytidine kinase